MEKKQISEEIDGEQFLIQAKDERDSSLSMELENTSVKTYRWECLTPVKVNTVIGNYKDKRPLVYGVKIAKFNGHYLFTLHKYDGGDNFSPSRSWSRLVKIVDENISQEEREKLALDMLTELIKKEKPFINQVRDHIRNM